MAETEASLSNYSHSVVPDSALVSGWYVANIINGVAVALPAFVVGANLMSALGTVRGVAALLTAGLIIAVIAAGNMYVACRERLNTVNILHRSFGLIGQKVISLIISVTLLGWYGVTAWIFGQASQTALEQVLGIVWPTEVLVVVGSALMTVTTVYGFHALDILSRLSVPLMFAILGAGAYRILTDYTLIDIVTAGGQVTEQIPSFNAAVSMIVGAFMVGVVMIPDLARFIRHTEQVFPASLTSYGTCAVLVMAVAGLPSLMTGEPNLIASMYQTGLGPLALIIMVLATWTTNVSNLYSTALGLAQLFPAIRDWKLTVFAGVVGTIIGIGGIVDHLFSFIALLGIVIPPIAGIYLSHFVLSGRSNFDASSEHPRSLLSVPAISSWTLASIVAFAASKDYVTLTSIPALDAWLSALLFYSIAWTTSVHGHRRRSS